jgi:hypothetical protein
MLKSVGLGLGAAVVGVGVFAAVKSTDSKDSILQKIDAARSAQTASTRFPFLESGAAVALEHDHLLEDLVERAAPFFQFDEDVGHAFAEAAAGAAEFCVRMHTIEHKRCIPAKFRAFTSVMRVRLRELRRAIREKAPGMLEEFDEVTQEVETYGKDSHHNMWCEAHAE